MMNAPSPVLASERRFPLDVMDAPDLATAASIYAQEGFLVLPVSSGVDSRVAPKAPLVQRGVHGASRDLNTVEGWWAQWPSAAIALALGPENGLFVLDVDCHENGSANGFETLARLRDLGFEFPPPNLVVETPSRGQHWYFSYPPGSPRSRKLPGLDLLGDGKYCLAPPSRMADDGVYKIVEVRA